MEIPDRIAQRLDGETIQSAVNLGEDDLVCFTPTRTLLYSSEGLLSDESVEVFGHDVERLNVSTGRRKTKFTLEYVDSVEEFSVSRKRGEPVLQRLLAGVLGSAGVIEEDESVAGVYLFSELTIVVTDSRMVKHVGSYVWDPDFEEFPFSDVTKLDFEEGSVATQIVISVDGRPQRIKAPSDEARKLEETLKQALFAYHDVRSLEELNEQLAPEEADAADETTERGGLGLDDSISPLVTDDEEDDGSTAEVSTTSTAAESANGVDDGPGVGDDGPTLVADADDATPVEDGEVTDSSGATDDPPSTGSTSTGPAERVDPEAFAELQEQVSALTSVVESQNEQLEKQRETIEQLIEELRRQI